MMTTHHAAAGVTAARTITALALGSALALAACGGGSDAAPAAPAAPAPAASAPAPAASTAAVVAASAGGTPSSGGSSAGHSHPQPSSTVTTSYAELTDVWRTGPSSYALSYDRVDFLTGRAAAQYYRKHPDQEPRDWAVSNTNPALRQLPAARTATFFGSQQLGAGNGSSLTRITGAHLVSAVAAHPRTMVKVSERPVGNHHEAVKIVEVYLP